MAGSGLTEEDERALLRASPASNCRPLSTPAQADILRTTAIDECPEMSTDNPGPGDDAGSAEFRG